MVTKTCMVIKVYTVYYGAPFVSKLGKMVRYIKGDGGIYTPMGVYM